MTFHNINIPSQPALAKAPEPAPTPAAPPADTTKTTPALAPASDATDALDDDGDVGFGLDDESDDSDGGAPAAADDAEPIQPIGPPPGATEREIADWREQHGVPDTPENYAPPTVDGVNWNTEALAPVLAAAHEHNIPQGAVEAALEAYAQQVAEQRADLKSKDKERLAEVRSQLTPSERGAIDAAAQTMSRELRTSIRQARLPTGELLMHNEEFLHLIANLNRSGGHATPVTRAQDDAALEETARLHMRTDIEKYYREGWDKKLTAILNRKGAA